MRTVDTRGLRSLGDEGFGPWLLGNGLLLRASTPRTSLATASAARGLADVYRAASTSGVMVPAVREIVRVGVGFGVVVDYLPGHDLGAHVAARSWAPRRAGRELGRLQRGIHEASTRVGKDWKAQFCAWARWLRPHVPRALGTPLVELVRDIPERSNLLHGDLHPGNVIVSDGRLAVIDWERAGFGHPAFDLAVTRSRLTFAMPRGFARVCRVVWDALLASYFEGATQAELDALDRQFAVLAEVESCCFGYRTSGLEGAAPSVRQQRRIDEAVGRLSELLPQVRSPRDWDGVAPTSV